MLPGKKYTPDEYARIAWRRRWYIAIPAVVIASATAVVSVFLPNQYRASTSILIIPQRVPENFVRPTVEVVQCGGGRHAADDARVPSSHRR